jgi:hypothetical protein
MKQVKPTLESNSGASEPGTGLIARTEASFRAGSFEFASSIGFGAAEAHKSRKSLCFSEIETTLAFFVKARLGVPEIRSTALFSGFILAFGVLTHFRCKRENQNASNSAVFNEIATSLTASCQDSPWASRLSINVPVFFLIRALEIACLHRKCVRTPKLRMNLLPRSVAFNSPSNIRPHVQHDYLHN